MDLRLSIEDHKRIMFWFYLAFKEKPASIGDKMTMIKIQDLARMKSHMEEMNKRYRN